MIRTAEARKEELLRDLVEARGVVLDAVQALPADACSRAFLGIWSAHDIVAHLIGWDVTNLEATRAVLQNRLPDFYAQYDTDWRSYNAQLVESYEQPTIAASISAAVASHAALLAFLETIPARDVFADHGVRSPRGRRVTISMLLTAEADDERKHAAQIEHFAATLAQ